MGAFFGRLGPEKKYFSTFFWFRPLGGPFWDPPFGPLLGPVLDPFWHFGPFWTHFGWLLGASNESENAKKVPKMGLTWPKMAQKGLKWPKMGQNGQNG